MNYCKDCKHFVNYAWSWPCFGWYERESHIECEHPNNFDTDYTTGEKSHTNNHHPRTINEGGNCKWFEAGKHKNNYDGEYAPGDTPEEQHPHLFTKRHAKDTQTMWGKLMKQVGVKAWLGR